MSETMMSETIWIEGIGTAAGVLTTFSALPQLLTTYRTRDVESFDPRFLVMLFAGLFLWAIYGFLIHALPVIIFNGIGCMLWLPIVVVKIRRVLSADRGPGRRSR